MRAVSRIGTLLESATHHITCTREVNPPFRRHHILQRPQLALRDGCHERLHKHPDALLEPALLAEREHEWDNARLVGHDRDDVRLVGRDQADAPLAIHEQADARLGGHEREDEVRGGGDGVAKAPGGVGVQAGDGVAIEFGEKGVVFGNTAEAADVQVGVGHCAMLGCGMGVGVEWEWEL